MGTQVEANELYNLLHLLESSDLQAAKEIEGLILQNLRESRESWLLPSLVEYFLASNSQRCMEILAAVQEPHDKHLCDKLLDHVRSGTSRLQTLTLLGHLIRKQPPWLHKIAGYNLFPAVIKCLKTETDVVVLMSGVLFLTAYLPFVPVTAAPYLQEIFEVFSRLAAFNLRKPAGHVPDVYLLHLQVGVYSLFHRLYGMYPCHFLTYMRATYSKKDNLQVFNSAIKPMLERVRMHPLLVTASKEKELSMDRWRRKEIHDILVDCSQLSLDLIEGTTEELRCPIMSSQRFRLGTMSQHSYQDASGPSSFQQGAAALPAGVVKVEAQIPITPTPIINALAAIEDSTNFWSPSSVCGLSTPPPVTMATSSTEVVSGATTASLQGTHSNTPYRTSPHLVFDSPYPGSVEESTEKSGTHLSTAPTTPGAVGLPTPQKRLSAISMSLAGKLPTSDPAAPPGEVSVPQSPLKPEFTTEPPLHAQRMQAIRKITFDDQPPPPADLETAVEAKEESRLARRVGVIKNALEKSGGSEGSPLVVKMETGASGKESVSQSTEPASEQTPPSLTEVPSVSQLAQLLDSLDDQKMPQDRIEEVDQEVSDLTRDRSDTSDDADIGAPSHLPPNVELTAGSVAAFMKKVNRIRFNTINVVRDRDRRPRYGLHRANSCPDLESALEEDHLEEHESLDDQPSQPPIASATHTYTNAPTAPSMLPDVVANGNLPESLSAISKVTTVTTTVTSQTEVFTTATDSQSVPCRAEDQAAMKELYPFVYPYTPMLFCHNCNATGQLTQWPVLPDSNIQSGLTTTTAQDAGQPFYTGFTPPDLLDRHIRLGSDVHAKELSQIPLTSQGTISWTHFGGVPPADEVAILRGQIQLLHTQVMFERHKRELHAKRNRRLLGRIVKTTALEEQSAAMQDQLRLQENEIQNLTVSLKLQQQQTEEIKKSRDSSEAENDALKRSHMYEIGHLQSLNTELEGEVVVLKERNQKLDEELLKNRAHMFEMERGLEVMRSKAKQTVELQEQVARLNKELLLMGELQQRYQQRLMSHTACHNPKVEMNFIMESYKNELHSTKTLLDHQTTLLDATRAKLMESEEMLKQKDVMLAEQKRMFDEARSLHKEELQACEDKYHTHKKVQLALQSQLLDLHDKVAQLQKADVEMEKESRPIPYRDFDGNSISTDTQTSPSLGFVEPSAFGHYQRHSLPNMGIGSGSLPRNFTITPGLGVEGMDVDARYGTPGATVSYRQSGLETIAGDVAAVQETPAGPDDVEAPQLAEASEHTTGLSEVADTIDDPDLVILTTSSEHDSQENKTTAD